MFVVVDMLLLVPVIVVAFQWPGVLWVALGAYLLFTFGVVAQLGRLSYRWGILELKGPSSSHVGRFLLATGLLTAALIVLSVLSPGFVWVWLALYVSALSYATYRLVAWQSRNLALRCQECGTTFTADLRTWTLSANMGSRKNVSCPECGRRTWARIVRRSEVDL